MFPAPGPPPRWNCGRARRRRYRAKEKGGARDPQTRRFGDRSRDQRAYIATTSSDRNYLFFSPEMKTGNRQNYSRLRGINRSASSLRLRRIYPNSRRITNEGYKRTSTGGNSRASRIRLYQ